MNAQDQFNLAQVEYRKLISLFKTNCTAIQKFIPTYSERIMLQQFDRILQAFLIHIACSDCNFDRIEIQFIRKITDYADILGGLDSIPRSQQIDGQIFFEREAKKILQKAEEFFAPIAIIDGALPQIDLFKEINKSMNSIAVLLMMVDGEVEECEKHKAAEMFVKYILNPYQSIKEHASKQLIPAVQKSSAPRNSLKDVYQNKLKKN
ncbi:MAG: hypothetical protein FWD58_02810 [Firmicutes bacterium]|nr:hypothetical protein [Bacillota bacterium]